MNDNQRRRIARSRAGQSRELNRESNDQDPSKGGSRGYPLYQRIDMMEMLQANGRDFRALANSVKMCEQTLRNWDTRLIPYEMNGGSQKTLLTGMDQLLMVLFLTAYPDATADEIAIFIINNGGEVYTRPAISRRMNELKYTQKRASIEAYQAFLPRNILRKTQFWSLPPPLGVHGLLRKCLFDWDECGIEITRCNRKRGVAHISLRVRKRGHYTKDRKFTVILCMEPGDPALPAAQFGSIQRPRRWFWIKDEAGTTEQVFRECVDQVCQHVETSNLAVDSHRVHLWDNLSSHLAPSIYNTVYGRLTPTHFDIVPRPPYMPKYGPTEYVFAELGGILQKNARPSWTQDDLRNNISQALSTVGMNGSFDRTFQHCGY